jgi:hypothetical protein
MESIYSKVLELKLALHRTQAEKELCARSQRFERASHLRDTEKQLRTKLNQLQEQVQEQLQAFNAARGDAKELVQLQAVWLELQVLVWQDFLTGRKATHTDDLKQRVLQKAAVLLQDLQLFLGETYHSLRSEMHRFATEGDEAAAQKALKRLAALGDLLRLFK